MEAKSIAELTDKISWYDGGIYAVMYKYLGGATFDEIVMGLIEPGSAVIDIGCGPGMLIFDLLKSRRCSRAVGIDLSSRMIEYANREKRRRGLENVEFRHMNAVNLSRKVGQRFDYAVTSFVLHELPEELRHRVLDEMTAVAKKLIIVEYTAEQSRMMGFLNWLMESLAGPAHLRNYRDFLARGGIEALLERHGLLTEAEHTEFGAYKFVAAVPREQPGEFRQDYGHESAAPGTTQSQHSSRIVH
jgi:demethylmenaquinone methyltransferase/2-methoxy-6-polyprenyl-1,4-benzoquinol methylase